MARIEHLNLSITQLDSASLTSLFHKIRENRRRRPTVKARAKKSTARTKRRAKSKKAPSQNDIFAMLATMTPEQKAKIAKTLLSKE